MARSVNFVWNYCCEIDRASNRKWQGGSAAQRPTAFDLTMLCCGVNKELGIHSDTISAICAKFIAARRRCFPRTPRFRSHKHSLDWIPFSRSGCSGKGTGRIEGSALVCMKRKYHLWYQRRLPDDGKLRSWCFSTDARNRWYVNFTVEVAEPDVHDGKAIGIDLGLKSLAVLSDGGAVAAPAYYRKSEAKLATLQRRGQKRRARALLAKVANQRKDFLHKASTEIVRSHAFIAVGDVSAAQLVKTRMAKSILDASWSTFRYMLRYKAIAHGATYVEVDERLSSQVCSACGSLPASRPKGIADLGVRSWVCSDCGASHDRDVNAARNILRTGAECRPPVAGILSQAA